MTPSTPISVEEAGQWLDVLSVLAGDEPTAIRERYLPEGEQPDLRGILQYARDNSDVFGELINPVNYDRLTESQKSALERFLRYTEYLDEQQVEEAAERDRRLRAAMQLYYQAHADEQPVQEFINQIILAIASIFGMEAEAREQLGIAPETDRHLIEAGIQGVGLGSERGDRAAQIAESLVGQRESGRNRGSIVSLVCHGQEGIPWCGGFVQYVLNQAAPGLIQHDGLVARSYVDPEIMPREAIRGTGYTPARGDVIVLGRGEGRGHVGIVTGVDENGRINYVAGNQSNGVNYGSYMPGSTDEELLGFLDVRALGNHSSRNIDMGVPSGISQSRPLTASVDGPSAYMGG